jgi:hypothetical protein
MTTEIKILANNQIDIAVLSFDGDVIEFNFNGQLYREIEERPFIALKNLRKKLENENIFLLINGSRKDVHPSGFTLNTTSAYVLEMGKSGDPKNIVGIFDATDKIELIATVEEQAERYKQWINSLKK